MKPKYGWIYLCFVLSLVILVATSVSFYRQFHLLEVHSSQLLHNQLVYTQLRDLKQIVWKAESNARGFMVTGDSMYLKGMANVREDISEIVDSLKSLFGKETIQSNRLILLNASLTGRINVLTRNIQKVAIGDTMGLSESLMHGQQLMHLFQEESDQIEKDEVAERLRTGRELHFFTRITPISFNIILVFSGILTLVSFLFILKEMRTRIRYQDELERKLKELNSSTSELERFTYVASHDLQEPLRKIRTFSDRLMSKHRDSMNEEASRIIERIDASSHRMQDLIQDMVNFTNLVNREETAMVCDLNLILEKTLQQMSQQVMEKEAMIKYDKLPIINGFREQLGLLFRSLLENALKFADADRQCEITIHYHQVEGYNIPLFNLPSKRLYHQIAIKDNGIGFDNEFASKIFLIFQRLHSQESPYHGKGIGLAIAQRVVANHNGVILARGKTGEGATFSIYFPIV